MTTAYSRANRVCAASWLLCVAFSLPSLGADPRVKVDSGLNDSGLYVYRITNLGSSPIVFVEIPHYLADQFNAPRGWKQECTYLSNIGVPKRPGLCSATAESALDGIAPGESAEFSLRMGLDGKNESRRGDGSLRLQFADKQAITVEGVSVPVKPPAWENYGLIGGYVVIIILLLAIFARRRPKKNVSPEDAAPPEAQP